MHQTGKALLSVSQSVILRGKLFKEKDIMMLLLDVGRKTFSGDFNFNYNFFLLHLKNFQLIIALKNYLPYLASHLAT